MEARLRSEENNRVQIYEELHEIAERLKSLRFQRKDRTHSGTPNTLEVKAKFEPIRTLEVRKGKQDRKKNFSTLYELSSSPSSMVSDMMPDQDSYLPSSLSIMAVGYDKPKLNARYHNTSPVKAKLPVVKTASPRKRNRAFLEIPGTSYTPVRYKVVDLDEESPYLSKRAV
jgi:hypothetical protein